MKRGFSLLEVIFVLVLIGILANVASGLIPNYTLLNDTRYIAMKMKDQQRKAIGYDTFNFGNSSYWQIPEVNSLDFNQTCVETTASFFNAHDPKKPYILTVTFGTNVTFCYDSLGRPYNHNGTSVQLIDQKVDIKVLYGNKISTISVLPMSGYVIIE